MADKLKCSEMAEGHLCGDCGKRIIAVVPSKLHAEIKTMASQKGTSIRNYILQAIMYKMSEDLRYK